MQTLVIIVLVIALIGALAVIQMQWLWLGTVRQKLERATESAVDWCSAYNSEVEAHLQTKEDLKEADESDRTVEKLDSLNRPCCESGEFHPPRPAGHDYERPRLAEADKGSE